MAKLWYVKYCETGKKDVLIAGIFFTENGATEYRSKLLSGAGGLFSLHHDVFVSDCGIKSKKGKVI